MSAPTIASIAFLLLTLGADTFAVEIPPEHHPWGRCKPKSWRRERVTTEEFAPNGRTSGQVSIVTTWLVKVEEDGVVLTREVTRGGQTTRHENVKYAWNGSTVNESTSVKYSVDEIEIEGKTYACQTHQLTTQQDGVTTVAKSWYSPDHSPHFLKHVVRVTGKHRQSSATRVTRLAVLKTVLDEPLGCWEMQTTLTSPADTTRTTSFSTMEIPGGLVSSESEVHHKQQGLKRRVRVELIAYDAVR